LKRKKPTELTEQDYLDLLARLEWKPEIVRPQEPINPNA